MSIEALAWALNTDAVDNPTSKLVLIALANHARPDGSAAFPSIATLQRYTCLSERAIQQHLRLLEQQGLISRCNPDIVAAHIDRADRRPCGYNLHLDGSGDVWARGAGDSPRATKRGEPHSPRNGHGVNVARERGERRSLTGCTTFTQTVHEPYKEPISTPPVSPSREKNNDEPALPEWLPADLWTAFRVHRKAIKKPMTARAEELNLRLLAELRAQGHDPEEILEATIANGWQGLDWAKKRQREGAHHEARQRPSAPTAVQRARAESRAWLLGQGIDPDAEDYSGGRTH